MRYGDQFSLLCLFMCFLYVCVYVFIRSGVCLLVALSCVCSVRVLIQFRTVALSEFLILPQTRDAKVNDNCFYIPVSRSTFPPSRHVSGSIIFFLYPSLLSFLLSTSFNSFPFLIYSSICWITHLLSLIICFTISYPILSILGYWFHSFLFIYLYFLSISPPPSIPFLPIFIPLYFASLISFHLFSFTSLSPIHSFLSLLSSFLSFHPLSQSRHLSLLFLTLLSSFYPPSPSTHFLSLLFPHTFPSFYPILLIFHSPPSLLSLPVPRPTVSRGSPAWLPLLFSHYTGVP